MRTRVRRRGIFGSKRRAIVSCLCLAAAFYAGTVASWIMRSSPAPAAVGVAVDRAGGAEDADSRKLRGGENGAVGALQAAGAGGSGAGELLAGLAENMQGASWRPLRFNTSRNTAHTLCSCSIDWN